MIAIDYLSISIWTRHRELFGHVAAELPNAFSWDLWEFVLIKSNVCECCEFLSSNKHEGNMKVTTAPPSCSLRLIIMMTIINVT